ncbi:hypothetical protein [Streptomyces sp. NPDC047974]|uniref:hypothetical protein n=1 Tax=Streptomyces sp. NPDC047974 TaxID=3154343 RepID=UPI0033FBF932
MTDDDPRSLPAAPAPRAARLFLATAAAVAALGYTATEALNAGMKPDGAGTGVVVSPAPSLPPQVCADATADFTACGPESLTCEQLALYRRALPRPAPDDPLLRTTLCADGTPNDEPREGRAQPDADPD